MNNCKLYHVANGLQKFDSEEIIKDFRSDIAHRCKNNDAELLDVGCGDGFVTAEILRKYVPESSKIYGIDINKDMINFAKSLYEKDNVQFSVGNIESDIPEDLKSRFDMVASFYCLHWVQDQRRCLSNIYSMLKDDGSCLLIYPLVHPVFDSYKVLMKNPIWADVMEDAFRYIPALAKFPDPAAECRRILDESNFQDIQVECKKKEYTYRGRNEFIDFFTSVNPFIKSIAKIKVEEYVNDLMNVLLTLPSIEVTYDIAGKIEAVKTKYELLVIYANK